MLLNRDGESPTGERMLFAVRAPNAERVSVVSDFNYYLVERREHRNIQSLLRDLNRLYRETAAPHDFDFHGAGFSWTDCHDASQSVLGYQRNGRGHSLAVVVFNFTPVPWEDYRIGVPKAGFYGESLNSDSSYYGGSDVGIGGGLASEPLPWMSRAQSIRPRLPPWADWS